MVKEGYWYGLPLVLTAGGLLGIGAYLGGVFFLALALFILNFFRDPDRTIPADPCAVVAPADGRIVQIVEENFEGRPVQRVSIFMSPLDVHVNRSPIGGTLESVIYKKGTFHVASGENASLENEQNVLTISGEQGIVVVKQIAGILARRIIFWKQPGDNLGRGERIGLIKFGSRVDILVEPSVSLQVKPGDRTRAGSSILGTSRAQS